MRGLPRRCNCALLQHAQQLGLQLERQLADFVEEDGAVVGQLEPANLRAVGAGVGALLAAEQLALDQVGGEGGAVDGDERAVAARAAAMDGARQEFLARAGLAEEQHRGRGRGHLRHPEHDETQGVTVADDLVIVLGLGGRGPYLTRTGRKRQCAAT